ncbi:methyltransferase domain-containing protein [Paenibacillus turpanensis]|uniref:methyltransferase domain-containing protein n=1 Tax=Paenibacillus turpanensis TaxID=2689078 RepID=UPI00140B1A5D|nr:methyltransferase domain-containing protein [Paenibacillus turpanensis]
MSKYNKQLVRKHFDKQAGNYEQYAEVQALMAEELANRLPRELPDHAEILEIGCGTGMLTRRLLRKYPNARVTAVDLSQSMLDYARKAIEELGEITSDGGPAHAGKLLERVDFREADIEVLAHQLAAADNRNFDLIVSSAAFQWLNDPEGTMGALLQLLRCKSDRHASPDQQDEASGCHGAILHAERTEGQYSYSNVDPSVTTSSWMHGRDEGTGGQDSKGTKSGLYFATFGDRTFFELRQSFTEAETELGLPGGSHTSELLSGKQWTALFTRLHCSLSITERMEEVWFPNVRQFLRSVQRVGASHAPANGNDAAYPSGGKTLFRQMEQRYLRRYGSSPSGAIPATYHLIYGYV